GEAVDEQKLEYVISLHTEGTSYAASDFSRDIIAFTHRGKPIKAKTRGQKDYVEAIRNREIVFSIGPAGTGKTYLAVAMAVSAYKNKQAEKIILARPAVEAGERLGFLPGDLQEKVDPYLRPLYDALYDIMGRDTALRLKERETIEVVPLAYMRGRTLDNSFIILDEAQNTTREQMKMFLTRMGFGSRVVVTGDVTQIDLPEGRASGLLHAERVLSGVSEITFCRLTGSDVVRHSLVKKIIGAYEKYEKKASDNSPNRPGAGSAAKPGAKDKFASRFSGSAGKPGVKDKSASRVSGSAAKPGAKDKSASRVSGSVAIPGAKGKSASSANSSSAAKPGKK
ncbi:MAG: PhoH family protein, partial [Clostridiales Family XIII bacterium]|nr:PhoH family protein [Clostridiales Family XIII bacterium]